MDPTEMVKRVSRMPRDPTLQDYFFQRVQERCGQRAGEFLAPMLSQGFFHHVPQAIGDGERTYHPTWPAGRFLASVAAQQPRTAIEILEGLPSSRNRFVLRHSLEAALALPGDLLARWVASKLRTWRREDEYFDLLRAESLGMIAARLLGQHPWVARGVATLLLSPASSATTEADTRDPRAGLRIDDYEAERLIGAHLQLAVQARPLATIVFFVRQLQKLLANHGDAHHPFGHPSSWWRPAIADNSQNVHTHDPKTIYLDAVRDACMQALAANPDLIARVGKCLLARPATVFKRIALHVLRSYPEVPLACQMVLDGATMQDVEFHHEYWELARVVFPRLTVEERAEMIRRILRGPGDEIIAAIASRSRGRPAAAEEVRMTLAWWRLRRLVMLEPELNEGERRLLDAELAITGGRPEHPEFLSYHEVGWGNASPIGLDQLRRMTDAELIEWLRIWQPPPRLKINAPTREGLARTLARLVAEEPERLLRLSTAFLELNPTLCRGYVEGWDTVAGAGVAVDWHSVVHLIREVGRKPVGQPRDLARDLEGDGDWGPCRAAACGLLRVLVEKNLPPLESRGEVWGSIEDFLQDPDPDASGETSADLSDPITAAINSVRGKALQAVVGYCLWLKSRIPNWAGLSSVPEVLPILTRHADARRERSIAIHAMYGWLYRNLCVLDARWATEASAWIFPREAELSEYRDAAWGSFLSCHEAHPTYLRALRAQYELAVGDIGVREIATRGGKLHEQTLGEHLLAFYWQGALELESGSLLVRYLDASNDELRGHVVESVGRTLKNADNMDEFCRQRLMRFWEARLGAAGGGTSNRSELAGFTWWFAATEFPGQWALERMLAGILLGGGAEPEFLFFERLAELSAEHGKLAFECLKALLDTKAEFRDLQFHTDEVRTVLLGGMNFGDSETVREVRETVSRLAFNGMPEFREVIGHDPDSPRDGAPEAHA